MLIDMSSKGNLETLDLNAAKIVEAAKRQLEREKRAVLRELLKDIQPTIKRRNELLKKMRNCSKCKSVPLKFIPCKKHMQKLLEIDNELRQIKISYKLAEQIKNLK